MMSGVNKRQLINVNREGGWNYSQYTGVSDFVKLNTYLNWETISQ